MDYELAEVVDLLQKSHKALAGGNSPEARISIMKAAMKAGTLLNDLKSEAELRKVKPIAAYTLQWYDKLRRGEATALTMSEKLLWLTCDVCKSIWHPVFQFENGLSLDFVPFACKEVSIKLPNTGFLAPSFKTPSLEEGIKGFDDLCQDLLPNCSFVLSLLSIHDLGLAERLERLVIYNEKEEVAKVKLFINGCEREITISTKLPFLKPPHDDRSLIVRSSTNNNLYWPALIEKAYLISLGDHYAFLGSNMAQDTFILIGWAPEVRNISKMSLDLLAELWELKQRGLVALGLGTGRMLDSLASKLKVVSGHDYVVSGYSNKGMTLKNPWVSTEKDRFLEVDASIFGHFTYLYLNWNMDALYKHSTSIVAISPKPKYEELLLDRPQFTVENGSSDTQTVGFMVEQFLLKEEPVCSYNVSVYENTNGKVVYSSQYVRAAGGKLTSSRTHYLKFDIPAKSKYTAVIAGPKSRVLILAKLWSNSPAVKMYKAKPHYNNVTEIEDAWTKDDNGGNWALGLYIDNPQWELEIKQRIPKMFIAVSSSEGTDLNFHLLHTEKTKQLTKLRNFDKSKLLFSDNYSYGIQHHELQDVEPGNLRLVVSNFNPEYTGDFHLLVMYDGVKSDLKIEKVPKALGLYDDTVQFSWKNRNRYKYTVSSAVPNTSVTFKLQAGTETQTLSLYRPAVRASLFDSATQQPVVVNDKWNDSVYGVFVDCELKKQNHEYILLVERFETGEGVCRIKAGSSSKVVFKGEDD